MIFFLVSLICRCSNFVPSVSSDLCVLSESSCFLRIMSAIKSMRVGKVEKPRPLKSASSSSIVGKGGKMVVRFGKTIDFL